ncbi:hypothetical protein SADO_00340 [Salinisphaera dokdonensis CL-ES53]|uniref:Uncharacterized protein n=1 Tax=Salinisphaera dokdonensis CL-ES53 TaxID=1304272 RepID=A0ABV2AVM4_9GAMM
MVHAIMGATDMREAANARFSASLFMRDIIADVPGGWDHGDTVAVGFRCRSAAGAPAQWVENALSLL